MKKKEETYLPLTWCQNFGADIAEILNGSELEQRYRDMRILCENGHSLQEYVDAYNRYDAFCGARLYGLPRPQINDIIAMLTPGVIDQSQMDTYNSFIADRIHDIDAVSLLNIWGKNKQVYKFDRDFINALSETETVKIVKDLYDRLPYRCFYLDFSDNPDICEKIQGDGVVVYVRKFHPHASIMPKLANEDYCWYELHLTKLTKNLFFSDCVFIKNEDLEKPIEEEIVPVNIIGDGSKNSVITDRSLYKRLIVQCLTYLSSESLDIRENETTKRTYRPQKPGQQPKHKFSEVREQDIGVRFGSAYRKWRSIQNTQEKREPGYTGRKNRPHYRRAHWHTYLYGKGRTERKIIWQHECAVNMALGEEVNVVIHKTK